MEAFFVTEPGTAARVSVPWGMPLVPGSQLGHIRVDELLGKGGMSEVYRGYDTLLDRPVALKVIREKRLLSPLAQARFMREARILSRLDHPGVCRVHDVIQGEKQYVLVLEHIEGRTLRRMMAEGMELHEKLRVVEAIAEVLAAAHSQGIVHRDIKPENVMITNDRTVKLVDFDLARPEHGAEDRATRPGDEELSGEAEEKQLMPGKSTASETTVGTIVGTVSYMSPEQARGDALTVASDLYSLGVLMHELFTGSLPYPPGLTGKARLITVSRGETLKAEGCDPRLAALIEGLKNPEPGLRPDAHQVARALHRLGSDRNRGFGRRIVEGLRALIGRSTDSRESANER